ncbi:MAG: rhodanese-like domain-containing protein [Bacteroidia bacterium]
MKFITPSELKSWMDNKKDFQLIDIREQYEYETANIGEQHIPMGEILDCLYKIDKHKDVVIHCKSGNRSEAVIQALEANGFNNLHSLEGGIQAWCQTIDSSLLIL